MTTSSPSKPRLRLAIVGGGIGGLLCAIALAPYEDIQIDIYEGAAKFETIGAGLALWGESITVFKKLGIYERLLATAQVLDAPMQLKRANRQEGEVFGAIRFSEFLGLHRATFLAQLVNILKETNRATIHFAKRCDHFVQSEANDEVTIHFKDGTTATCELLIGSDGIRSSIRKQLIGGMVGDKGWDAQDRTIDASGLRFSGTVAYRGLINTANLPDHPVTKADKAYCGSIKHIVAYPVAAGKFINLIAYSTNPDRHDEWMNGPWTLDVDRSEVLNEFSDLETEAQILLKAIENPSRWTLFEVDPLPTWAEGRVALLGDACHGMNPFIGAAGGQVIEDGYVLAHLLGNTAVTRKDVPHILRSYEFIRKPRAEKILGCTREAKLALESLDEYATSGDEHINDTLNKLIEWLHEGKYDIDADIERGKKEFERLKSRAEAS